MLSAAGLDGAESAVDITKAVLSSLPPDSLNGARVAGNADIEDPFEVTVAIVVTPTRDGAVAGALAVHVVPKTAADAGDVVNTRSGNLVLAENGRAIGAEDARSGLSEGGKSHSGSEEGLDLHIEGRRRREVVEVFV